MNKVLNKYVLAALCATPLFLNVGLAQADEMAAPAAAEPAPPYTLTFNIGLYSQYMFRGVALSDGPALQGGIDWAHSSGFYLGTWWSNIDTEFTGNGDGFSSGNQLETDWYGGYAHTFDNGFGVNFLGNYYYYPNRENSYSTGNFGNKQDTFEGSVALSYSYFTYTHYHVFTDYYGAAKDGTIDGTRDTKGARYDELKVNYKLPVGDLNFMAKVGYQHTPNLTGSQGDYAIGLNRDFNLPSSGKPIGGFNAGGYFTNTFSVKNQAFYNTNTGRDTNQATAWFYVKRTW